MTCYHHFPIGFLRLSASEDGLQSIDFVESEEKKNQHPESDIVQQTIAELGEYFDGDRQEFSVPLDVEGTAFQKSVWKAVREIPYGQTKSYGELAQMLGDPNKVRAAGRANGQNPIPIIIPCHRVIGSNNQLVGYSGGIERKKYLLRHEGALLL